MKAQQYEAAGEPQVEARYHAERRFGNAVLVKESLREAWSFAAVEGAWRDLGHAFRALRRSPGFTLVAVLTLGIGIGANTSVFTVLNAMFLRSLPVRDPQQLRVVAWTVPGRAPARSQSGYSTEVNGIKARSSFSIRAATDTRTGRWWTSTRGSRRGSKRCPACAASPCRARR